MADLTPVKISALPAAANGLAAGDLIPIVRAGTTSKATFPITIDSSGNVSGIANLAQTLNTASTNVARSLTNQSNTAGAGAVDSITVAGATASDPVTTYTVAGVQSWTIGIDNSASDAFVIAASTALGSGNVLSIAKTGVSTFSQSVLALASVVGSPVIVGATNNDNTNTASDAHLRAVVGGASGGDPRVLLTVSGAQSWTLGIDNSASDAFVIAASTTLGTSNVMSISTAGAVSVSLGDMSVERANVGAAVVSTVANTDNTNGASHARMAAVSGGSSGGDAYASFTITSVQDWSVGIDNSASDAFVISASITLGTNNAASWSTAGVLTNTGAITATTGNITATDGNLVMSAPGNKLVIATGANASIGTSAAMTAGAITINTTAVSSASTIFLTHNTFGGTAGVVSAPVASIVDGTSFGILSSSNTDTSTVNWWIVG